MDDRLFIYGLVVFVLLGFLIRAALDYKNYRGTLNQHLYANYLIDYYWHYYIRKDNSRSALLKQELGEHRLIHAQISDSQGAVVARFVTVIHHRGLTLVCYMHPHGIIQGKTSDRNWLIQRKEEGNTVKNYKIPNPLSYMETYRQHLLSKSGVSDVAVLIAIGGEEEIRLQIAKKTVRYSELVKELTQSDAGYALNENEIEEIFRKLSDKKEG